MSRKILMLVVSMLTLFGMMSTATAKHQMGNTSVAGVFMQISNSGSDDDRLVSATSDVAQTVEVHEIVIDGNMMTMQRLADGLVIPAGETVELKPKSYHVMLIGLHQDLKAGSEFSLGLTFEKAGSVELTVPVLEQLPAAGSNEGTSGPIETGSIKVDRIWARQAPKTGAPASPAADCATPASGQMACAIPGSATATPAMTGHGQGHGHGQAKNQSNGAFYMTITNKGAEADRLLSVSSDVADAIEIHDVKMNGSQMEMFMLKDPVEIPAGESVEFKPKHKHVMLMGIHKSLLAGESFDVTLHFEKAGDITMTVPVTSGGAPDGAESSSAGNIEVSGVWAREAPKVDTGTSPMSTPASTPKS